MSDKVAGQESTARDERLRHEPLAVVYVAIICCAVVILVALGAYAIA